MQGKAAVKDGIHSESGGINAASENVMLDEQFRVDKLRFLRM